MMAMIFGNRDSNSGIIFSLSLDYTFFRRDVLAGDIRSMGTRLLVGSSRARLSAPLVL